MFNQRREIERVLRREILQDRFWQNRDDQGSSVLALRLIGDWRLSLDLGYGVHNYVDPSGIVALLSKHLTFRVDFKTVRVGASYTPLHFTPVVAALVQIDSAAARRAMLEKLAQTDDLNQRICALYVLRQNQGDFAALVLTEANRREQARSHNTRLAQSLALLPDIEQKFANFAYTGDGDKPRFSGTAAAATPEPDPTLK